MMGELTRDQFEEQLLNVHVESVEVRVKSMACLRNHDAALRATIQQLEAQLAQWDGFKQRDVYQALVDARAKVQQLEAQVKELAGQLPEGMTHCTIIFKECPVGHGRLTAANWIPQECPWCLINSLKIRIRAALDSSPDSA